MENKNSVAPYILITVLAFLVLGGFYIAFDRMSDLRTEIKNSQLELELFKKSIVSPSTSYTPSPNPTAPASSPTSSIEYPPAVQQDQFSIPTGLTFTVKSNPNLQPQTDLTVNIEKVELKNGTATLSIKALTPNATGYSAFDASNFFELVSLESDNTKALEISPIFNSIPPKAFATGIVTFKTDPTKSKIIIQMGTGLNMKFYEFDFVKKTYQEIVLG